MPMPAQAKSTASVDPSRVLSKATLRAAKLLDVSQAELADIIGVSSASISRLANEQRALEQGSKSWQLAALFVRLFRSLDAMLGSDDAAAKVWIASSNIALGGIPKELIRDAAGLVRTVDYLDAARARI
jgi:transcriptional regulator with XRE-family HTH domain